MAVQIVEAVVATEAVVAVVTVEAVEPCLGSGSGPLNVEHEGLGEIRTTPHHCPIRTCTALNLFKHVRPFTPALWSAVSPLAAAGLTPPSARVPPRPVPSLAHIRHWVWKPRVCLFPRKARLRGVGTQEREVEEK